MSTITDRIRCITCGKEKVTSRCEGCLQSFCFNHIIEHRQELKKQLDEIEIHRDQFQQIFSQSEKHPLIQQIDQWEQDSIQKIKQLAEETRQLLLKHTNKYINQIEQKLNKLTNQLKLSREKDD